MNVHQTGSSEGNAGFQQRGFEHVRKFMLEAISNNTCTKLDNLKKGFANKFAFKTLLTIYFSTASPLVMLTPVPFSHDSGLGSALTGTIKSESSTSPHNEVGFQCISP